MMAVVATDLEDTARSVQAELNYLLPGPDINRRFVSAGFEVNTGSYGPFQVTVRDGRDIRRHFTLDRHGFTLADNVSAVSDFYDRDEVNRIYPDEVARSVQALTGATFVVPGGWMIRNSGDISRFQKKQEGPYVHAGGV